MTRHESIGYAFPPFRIQLEPGRVSLYRKAIGLPPDTAAGDPVPPAMLGVGFEPDPFNFMERFEIGFENLLHAEQELKHHRPARVGERLHGQKRVANIFEKKGGALLFVVFELQYRDDEGALVCESIQTLVVRREVSE